jgi:hypothetical protein
LGAGDMFWAMPLESKVGKLPKPEGFHRYGVPFVIGALPVTTNEPGQVKIGCPVKRIFLLGMTESGFTHSWADPRDHSVRFFLGDELGRIQLNYADGSTQIFPLIFGESIWFGKYFYQEPEPFSTDKRLQKAFVASLRLYPPAPVEDGNYVAVITPKPGAIQSITVEASPAKRGSVVISGVTVESDETNSVADALAVSADTFPPEFKQFVQKKSLRSFGEDKKKSAKQLNDFRQAFYSSDKTFFQGHVTAETPPGYAGPEVAFRGDVFARVLANAFAFNIQDMLAKIGSDGMYHTSTKGASFAWGAYQFGTYRTNVGRYYDESWCRDMGRSLQELTELGFTNDAARCAEYCLRAEQLWEKPSAPKYHGKLYPPHWSRIANKPQNAPPYENDGHGLVTMFLYKFWQRLPDRDGWLRAHWTGLKAAGDWILWQFDHPEISGATNGVLHTTSECSAMNGYSVYADDNCLDALRALTQMADSIGETNSAAQWRARADKMQEAITDQYVIEDPTYGRVWTLDYAGWPDKSTVLGPLIFQPDYQGFAPEDGNPQWRAVNEAAYRRLIDTYQPFGFYGQAMGYGQGFVTQSALLLDRMRDATQMLDWAAKQIYNPRRGSFIVPEGVQIEPTGRFWYQTGDLGNGVQEAEIIKALRLVIGVDDTQPNRLQFFPRMPYGWNEISVKKYPVLAEISGQITPTHLSYDLKRSGARMKLAISSDKNLGTVAMRLGPFSEKPDASSVLVNGKAPEVSVKRSGDSWWVEFTAAVGPGN